jgi:hypothetical protein
MTNAILQFWGAESSSLFIRALVLRRKQTRTHTDVIGLLTVAMRVIRAREGARYSHSIRISVPAGEVALSGVLPTEGMFNIERAVSCARHSRTR